MRKRLRWGVLYSDLLPVRLAWEAASAEDLDALDALKFLPSLLFLYLNTFF